MTYSEWAESTQKRNGCFDTRFTCRCALFLTIPFLFNSAYANDNLLAHSLYKEGRYAEAAEIFTNPAWKGVALYRSAQWWRAAEAFVRADDADSFYNLGNAYVKLGYYALALEAYQAAIAKQPGFDDALFNADVMRKLLANDKDEQGKAALKPETAEIDRVEADNEEDASASEDDSGEGEKEEREEDGDREGDTDSRSPTPEASANGNSSEAGSNDTLNESDAEPGGSVKGTESETDSDSNPSGGSEGKQDPDAEISAGLRAKLESEQATEQWLNQIKHDAGKYLRAMIELETQRRRQAGQAAPQGGSQW